MMRREKHSIKEHVFWAWFSGGPEIARAAKVECQSVSVPRPMIGSGDDNFSFSGLNCFTLHHSRSYGKRNTTSEHTSGFGGKVTKKRFGKTLAKNFSMRSIAMNVEEVYQFTGGVSANRRLREVLFSGSNKRKIGFPFPEKMEFCTDIGAMIAERRGNIIAHQRNVDWRPALNQFFTVNCFKKNDDKSNSFRSRWNPQHFPFPLCFALFRNIQFFKPTISGDTVIHPPNWSPDRTYF